jgi:hypothetical protein
MSKKSDEEKAVAGCGGVRQQVQILKEMRQHPKLFSKDIELALVADIARMASQEQADLHPEGPGPVGAAFNPEPCEVLNHPTDLPPQAFGDDLFVRPSFYYENPLEADPQKVSPPKVKPQLNTPVPLIAKPTDTIILVGNAQGIMQSDGTMKPEVVSIINDHDIIVRMNGGYRAGGDDLTSKLGRPADYWSFTILDSQIYKYVKWKLLHPYATELRLDRKFSYAPQGGYNGDLKSRRSLMYDYGHSRPSTGLQTLHYITHFWNKNLSIIGFDFFKTKNWFTNRAGASTHDWDREKEYVSSMPKVTIL